MHAQLQVLLLGFIYISYVTDCLKKKKKFDLAHEEQRSAPQVENSNFMDECVSV